MTTKKRNIRQPQQLPMSKIEGYFMITKADALLAVSQKLTGSQLRLWIYLMATDSFADYTSGGEVKYHDLPPLADIAVAIGGSLDRVEKDLRKLRKLGLYDYRTVTVQGHNLTAAKAKVEAQRLARVKSQSSPRSNQVKCSAYLDPDGDYLDRNGDYLDRNGDYLDRNESLKSLPDKPSSPPHTIQTYSDFIQTLSDSERESFEKFVREEWKRLKGEEVISMERFLANEEDFKNWHQKFLNSPAGREALKKATRAQFDWRNDPRFETWIWEAFNRGYEWVHESEAEREQRLAFYNWAFEVNAFEGVCL